ncbi:hypothetical protein [Duncaniella freteri]|jgi:hypothetical protein|uniref:Uncharacterized protein n=3 Tax=Duncaniella TaxID=2518495 RepID=A0A4Z0V3U1_9BACT|nr:hypothetical protein [Duncaniella freteri]TGG39391.1 hypothetical protein EZ315_01185 [Duncaniella freteri]
MKDILEKVNRNDGMTVPDGYFDDFATRMAASLPPMDWEKDTVETRVMSRSIWQKVRPYVYLAAMFMGVWCMMKMFDMMRPDTRGLNLDNNPVITAAVGNDYFFNDYVITHGDMSEYQLMEDLYETGYIPAAYEYHESSEYVDGDSSLTEI